MADEKLVGDIIEKIKRLYGNEGPFPQIKREVMQEYVMDEAIARVEVIGRMRSSSFTIDRYNRNAYENVIRWIHNDPEMVCMNPRSRETVKGNLKAGLFISGNTGSGKSWLLDIMSVYARVCGFRMKIGDRIMPLSWTNKRTDRICDEYSEGNSIMQYKDREIIGFQDLGSEPVEAMNMGTRLEVMRSILESRSDDDTLVTIISSNMRPCTEKFMNRYGERVDSRIASMCNYIELSGPDRRRTGYLDVVK